MGFFRRLLGWLLPGPARARGRGRRATYDAAGDGADNRRHWQAADALSARSANSLEVRKTLRERARYEAANNGYALGLVLTLANDLVGTGPTLQVLLTDRDQARQVETAFARWADSVGLAQTLHTAKQSKTRDGETFLILTNGDEAEDPATSVQLDVQLVECDQVTDPTWEIGTRERVCDGVEYDARGRPLRYYVLEEHPGDVLAYNRGYQEIAARFVCHWFRRDRAGQCRGVPEITPALPLFAQLRRYTLATVAAAETAANIAALLKSNLPPNTDADGDEEEGTPWETQEIERNALMTLPNGYELQQLEAKHPNTLYQEFKRELLKEVGRPVNAPFNVVSGDSSPYNYSSARLDHLLYRGAVRVEREHCRRTVLEPVFRAWLEEAVMVPGLLPAGLTPETVPHAWRWPGFSTIDPQKEAAADTEALANYTTTLAEKAAEENKDWEDQLRQAARERALMRELGLDIERVAERIRTEPVEPEPAKEAA